MVNRIKRGLEKRLDAAREWRETHNKRDTVQKSDLDSLNRMLSKMDMFLSLNENPLFLGENELQQAVRDCFETWRALLPLQTENDRAEIVLSAFYQQGKIEDFLKKLQAFVERMEQMNSDDTAREMGYSNYLFFLENFVLGMREQYEKKQAEPCPEAPERTPDNVAWFISAECGQIAPLQDLPKARAAVRRLLDETQIGQEKTKEFTETALSASDALELLGQYSQENLQELRTLSGIFAERAQAMRRNIEKGTSLYRALTSVMTEAWFRSFDPETEDSPVRGMSRSELKDFYLERLDRLKLPAGEDPAEA